MYRRPNPRSCCTPLPVWFCTKVVTLKPRRGHSTRSELKIKEGARIRSLDQSKEDNAAQDESPRQIGPPIQAVLLSIGLGELDGRLESRKDLLRVREGPDDDKG